MLCELLVVYFRRNNKMNRGNTQQKSVGKIPKNLEYYSTESPHNAPTY